MKSRIIVLIFILCILIINVGCSNNGDSDITTENLTDKTIDLDFSEDTQTESAREEIKVELIKTFDENHNRYNFAYKRSSLSIRKEMFERNNLTDEHIQKFFDDAEIVYDKLVYLFPAYEYPEVIAYHYVPAEWGSEADLYDDYSENASRTGAWANLHTKETFFKEGENSFLKDMDTVAFTSVIGHEVGHLFTLAPYVWDFELFSYFAMFYIRSEFPMNSVDEGAAHYDWHNWENLQWIKFFDLTDKYSYDILSDTFKEMLTLIMENILNGDNNILSGGDDAKFELFRQVLSQKTGDDIDYYFFGFP